MSLSHHRDWPVTAQTADKPPPVYHTNDGVHVFICRFPPGLEDCCITGASRLMTARYFPSEARLSAHVKMTSRPRDRLKGVTILIQRMYLLKNKLDTASQAAVQLLGSVMGQTPSVCVAVIKLMFELQFYWLLRRVTVNKVRFRVCRVLIGICMCNQHTCFYQPFRWQNKDSSAISFERVVSVSVANVCPVEVTTCHGVEGLG